MFRKFLIVALLVAPMCMLAQTKLGSVNTQEILSLMPELTSIQNQLNEVSKKYETEFQALREEFDKKYSEYQSLAQDTPESIKQRREQELAELQQKIQQFQQVAGEDIQRQQQTLFAPVQEKVTTAIQAVGSENGFTFIFDLSMPTILYKGKDAVDVTPLVKQKLGIDPNAKPAATTAPASTSTPATTTPAN